VDTCLFVFRRGRCRHRSICGAVATLNFALMLTFAGSASAQSAQKHIRGQAIVLVADDFKNHSSETQYYVRDEETGNLQALRFTDTAPQGFRTGAVIEVAGPAQGEYLTLQSADARVQKAAPISPLMPAVQTASAPVTFSQDTLVILLNFLDQAAVCTVSTCSANVFGAANSAQSLYAETSHGNVTYTGATVGPYTIAVNSTDSCASPYLPTFEAWGALADAEAQKAGIDLSGYTEKVYVIPSDPCGKERGYATIGGSPGLAWIAICHDPEVFTHEMGHNLGMAHARTLTNEYGDESDIMGNTTVGLRNLDAPHRDQFNWIPAANLLNITASGTYTIAPLELGPSQTSLPQALKIFKPDTNEYYYFSFRQPIGYDTLLPTLNSGTYTGGVSVHRFAGPNANDVHTFFLQALTDGASFTDSVNKLTVTQISHERSGAKVTITMGGAAAVLSPNNLSFAAQVVSTTSSAQVLTLSNSGTASLSISSIGTTGANSGDFAISSNSCAASLAASANCSLAVEFQPTASGVRSASLTVSDSAGTQTVSLSGTAVASDFAMTPSAPTSVTISAGSTATYTVAVNGEAGFTSNVSLSCAVPAPESTCSARPLTVAPGGTATITVTTTAHQLLPPIGTTRRLIPWRKLTPVIFLLVLSVTLQALGGTRRFRLAYAFAFHLILVAAFQSGCAATISSTVSKSAPAAYGTQAGTYTIMVTGTCGNLTHTATLTLIVK
jgi:gametolysin peptidase M11